MIKFSAISFLFDLVQDARIFYLIVFCKEDNLSQYLGSLRIFIYERQEQASAILRMYRKNGYLCTTLLMDHTARPGNVADPWYTEDFEATWQDVLEGYQGLLKEFMTERGDSNGTK